MISARELNENMAAAKAMLPTVERLAENLRRASEEFRRLAPTMDDFAKAFAAGDPPRVIRTRP